MPTLTPTALTDAAGRYVRAVRAALAAVLTREWWEDVAEASVAQAWQVLLPFLGVLWASRDVRGATVAAVALQVAGAVAVVVVRRLAALTAPGDATLTAKTVIRAVSAAAGALAGFAVNLTAGDLAGVHWRAVLLATVGSLRLALIHRTTDPATTDVVADIDRLTGQAVAGGVAVFPAPRGPVDVDPRGEV